MAFTQNLIDIQGEKIEFNIRKEHISNEFINALTKLQEERIRLRNVLLGFIRERFPIEESLECSKELCVSIETDRLEINVAKQAILQKTIENQDIYLKQIDTLLDNNNKLQNQLDDIVRRLSSSQSSQLEEKKDN